MKLLLVVPFLTGIAAVMPIDQADARPGGCIKGAIVGGIAGHFVGHGGIGAAAGCAYGMHERNKYDRQNEGRSSFDARPSYCGAGKLISTTIKIPMAAITAIRPAKPRAVRILLGQSSAMASRSRKTIPMR